MLRCDSGELTYVNAGHNAPIVFCNGSATPLESTGMPMGLVGSARYETGNALLPRGGTLLIFTDGLTDSIAASDPAARLRDAICDDPATAMSNLKTLIDPNSNEDDVTILLVKRTAAADASAPAHH